MHKRVCLVVIFLALCIAGCSGYKERDGTDDNSNTNLFTTGATLALESGVNTKTSEAKTTAPDNNSYTEKKAEPVSQPETAEATTLAENTGSHGTRDTVDSLTISKENSYALNEQDSSDNYTNETAISQPGISISESEAETEISSQDSDVYEEMKNKIKEIDGYSVVVLNSTFYKTDGISLYMSRDAVNWEKCYSIDGCWINSVFLSNNRLYIHAINITHDSDYSTYTSTDGKVWLECFCGESADEKFYMFNVTFNQNKYYAVTPFSVLSSEDGVVWDVLPHYTHTPLEFIFVNAPDYTVIYGGGYGGHMEPDKIEAYVIGDTKGMEPYKDRWIISSAFGDGIYMATDVEGKLLVSTNGLEWDDITDEGLADQDLFGILFDGKRFIAAGRDYTRTDSLKSCLYIIEKKEGRWLINRIRTEYKGLNIIFSEGIYYFYK